VRSRWHVHRARSATIALLFAVAAIVLGAAIPRPRIRPWWIAIPEMGQR
jgi:hypothetical protein